jgi:hypothetical protein
MNDAAKVALPGTWTTADGREAGAWLRPITGADQAAIIDRIGRDPAPVLATDLIGACVLLEDGEPLGSDASRALSVGERETVLWRMRAMLSGDRIDAVVTCPTCDEKVSIEFNVADFLDLASVDTPGVVAEQVGGRLVEFRVPSGGDLEDLARRRVVDIEQAEAELAAACLLSVDGQSPTVDDIAELAGPVGERMAALEPSAELLFDSVCPVCGSPITASLDATGFLLEEMATGARYLFHEVHVLASTYHWSEGEILDLTPRRRHLYLDLISDAGGHAS